MSMASAPHGADQVGLKKAASIAERGGFRIDQQDHSDLVGKRGIAIQRRLPAPTTRPLAWAAPASSRGGPKSGSHRSTHQRLSDSFLHSRTERSARNWCNHGVTE